MSFGFHWFRLLTPHRTEKAKDGSSRRKAGLQAGPIFPYAGFSPWGILRNNLAMSASKQIRWSGPMLKMVCRLQFSESSGLTTPWPGIVTKNQLNQQPRKSL